MTKLYTDRSVIPDCILPDIFKYNKEFEYVKNIESCDFVLFPHWEAVYEYSDEQYIQKGIVPDDKSILRDAVDRLKIQSEANLKKVIIFYLSDSEKSIPVANSLIFRTSLYRTKKKLFEYALPAWKRDLIVDHCNGIHQIRKKNEIPKVGFRGSARLQFHSLMNLIRTGFNITNKWLELFGISFGEKYQWNKGQIIRRVAMEKLNKNRNIYNEFSIVIRGYINQTNQEVKELNYRKFVQNIFDTDYTLCVRGAGNYSFRFYETLSAGRIPLFVNTDCVLPLDDIIDWKKYCVWVEQEDINKLDQILLDFHNDLTNDDFEELQYNIRNLWLDWIRPKAYFGKFHHQLGRIIAKQSPPSPLPCRQ